MPFANRDPIHFKQYWNCEPGYQENPHNCRRGYSQSSRDRRDYPSFTASIATILKIVSFLLYLQESQDSLRLPDAEFNRWLQCLIVIDDQA